MKFFIIFTFSSIRKEYHLNVPDCRGFIHVYCIAASDLFESYLMCCLSWSIIFSFCFTHHSRGSTGQAVSFTEDTSACRAPRWCIFNSSFMFIYSDIKWIFLNLFATQSSAWLTAPFIIIQSMFSMSGSARLQYRATKQ